MYVYTTYMHAVSKLYETSQWIALINVYMDYLSKVCTT